MLVPVSFFFGIWGGGCGVLATQVCDGAVRHVRKGNQAGLEPGRAANRAVHVLRGQADGVRGW